MASVLPSCIGNTFCSHRLAACFLLTTLMPFFFPFLILCVPFLILFLAPLSLLGCSLLLLLKVQVSMQPRRSGKCTLTPCTRLEQKKEKIPAEEIVGGRRWEGLPAEHGESDSSNVQSILASGASDLTTTASDLVKAERHDDVKELHARYETDEEEETNLMEKMMENTEEMSSGFGREEAEEELNLMEQMREDREDMSSDFGSKKAEEGGVEVLPSSSPERSFDPLKDDAKELDMRFEKDEKQEEPNLAEEMMESTESSGFGRGKSEEQLNLIWREDLSSGFSREKAKEEGFEVLPSSSPESSLDRLNDDAKDLDMRHEKDEKQEPNLTEKILMGRKDISSGLGREKTKEEGFEVLPSSSPESSLDRLNDDAKELDTRHEKDEKQEEPNLTEGTMESTESSGFGRGKAEEQLNLMGREDTSSGLGREKAKEEGFEVRPSFSPVSLLDRPKEEQEVMVEGMAPGQEEEPMKAEDEQGSREGMDSSDKLFSKTTLSDVLREEFLTEVPSIHEHGRPHSPSFEASPVPCHASNIPVEEQFHDPSRDLPDTEPDVHDSTDEFYEVPGNLPDTGPSVLESMAEFDEVPSKDTLSEEIETHRDTGEHFGEEPPLSSEKKSGFVHLSELEKQDLLTLMEKEMARDEPSGSSSTDHIEHEAKEASAEELRDEEQPQQQQEAVQPQGGMLVRDKDVSFPSDSAEQDRPFESGTSAVSLPPRPIETIGSQDKLNQERCILADIDAIKKIVGYEGDNHASVMEQITGLYLFLGMEPYWDAEVEDLERAQTEVEVLKVVVGVK